MQPFRRLAARVSCVVSVCASLLVCGAPYRETIEREWARHDASRMAQIREAGTVRFVEGVIQWPGMPRDDTASVPLADPVRIDGDLGDASWSHAWKVPARDAGAPGFLLCHDGSVLYVAASVSEAEAHRFQGPSTALDAGGAVDGVKNGRYAFHCGHEPNPWWQVDLQAVRAIDRIVVYNRLDYAPGLHNADHLEILISTDGETWTVRHRNAGKHFGGVGGGGPLVVNPAAPAAGAIAARFVRLRIPSDTPIFFHLDEVEIYGPDAPGENLALKRPASQSSLSIWSRGGLEGGGLFTLGASTRVGLDARGGVLENGTPLGAGRAAVRHAGGRVHVELAFPFQKGAFPASFRPAGAAAAHAIAAGAPWRLRWAEDMVPGFGRNRCRVVIEAERPLTAPVAVSIEAVVFTPLRPERRIAWEATLAQPGAHSAELLIAHEGPAALIMTAGDGAREFRDGRAFWIDPVGETLGRARALYADAGTAPESEWVALDARARLLARRELADGPDPAARAALAREARWCARKAAFAGPLLSFGELLFVTRFTQETYPDVCLNHMPWCSRPGGDICVLTMPAHDAPGAVRRLLNGALGPGHVRGIDLWWDADRVVFGYARAARDAPPDGWLDRTTSYDLRRSQTPIHIYEIGIDGAGLRQLTDGEWSDLDPTYLAGGDVAFTSERCGYSLQCNEYDKDETSCNLYAVNPDSGAIRRLTVSKDGDYLPRALADGTIGYTRWEYQERGWAHIQSLWTVRPDGTGADAIFKQHFNEPWALEDVRAIPGSVDLAAIATGHHTLAAGPLVRVDLSLGINDPRGIKSITPGLVPPEGGMDGVTVAEGGVTGKGGFAMTPWPLSERHFIIARNWGAETEPAGYALYLVDVHGTLELLHREEAISCFMPIPLVPRARPPVPNGWSDASLPHATCTVLDASHGVDGIAREKIRYIRIAQRLPWPYDNTFGGHRYEPDVKSVMVNWTPARIIGTVPVEADGSARFRVPADTAVYFQILDEHHMELRRMRSFINFQKGEERGCVGCHETRAHAPPAGPMPLALRRDPSIPIPPPWGDRPVSFLRDVQPVFDRYCVKCHGGLAPAGGLDFSGGLTARHNRAYDTIQARGLVSRSNVGEDARITEPLAFGSHRSELVKVLSASPHRERAPLAAVDRLRLVMWIDANAPYYDAFINKRSPEAPYDPAADVALREKLLSVHGERCAACHAAADISRIDWIDLAAPGRSRFLAAPLPADQGGSGACGAAIYADAADPAYRSVHETITQAVSRAWRRPRRDLQALKEERGYGAVYGGR